MDNARRRQNQQRAASMLLPMRGWLLVAATLCGAVALSAGAETHSIPPHLLECYRNASLFHRENRLPATMETVVELIRKVERWPDFRMDLRTFSLSLLYMFRLDGIERDYDIVESDYVTPYSLSGEQYYKHRILLEHVVKYLTPTTGYTFPNESLSSQEKCSLHFMMSNSIDDAQRGDESTTCAAIHSRRRRRRDVGDVTDDDADFARPEDEEDAPADHDDQAEALPLVAAEDDHDDHDDHDPLADVETVPLGSSEASPAPPAPPAPAAAPPAPPISSDVEILNVTTSGDDDQKGDMRWARDGDPNAAPRVASRQSRVTVPKSTCPVENGVVRTRWGSVHLGTLLAGVAAGLNREIVPLNDLRRQLPSRREDADRTLEGLSVDNLWAATLAGDLAEVALSQGPRSSSSASSISVGAAGNWNNTQAPRWFFINRINDMTDAEIRGGIDGLIIGSYIQEWYQTMNRQLKLSTLLERYYSTRGIISQNNRACKRQDHFPVVAPQDKTRQQALNFAYLLMDQNPKIVSIAPEQVETYTNQAVQSLIQYVPSDLSETCDEPRSLQYSEGKFEQVVPVVDLNFIYDCSWRFDQVKSFFENLASHLNLDDVDPGSSITIRSGSDFKVLINTTRNSTGFTMHLQKNITEFSSCSGMNLKNLLDTHLRDYYTNDLDRQKNETDLSINAKVVVLMPGPTYDLSITEAEEVKDLMTDYRTKFPDVKFIIFAQTRRENFLNIVEEGSDIITFDSIDNLKPEPLIKRLKEVPRRISNPICGSEWKERTYGPYEQVDYVGVNQTAFYRINSKYLFGVGSETIKIREQNSGGTVKVCYSRTQKYPSEEADNDSKHDEDDDNEGEVTCKIVSSGSSLEIPLDKPCKGQSNFLSCRPLYISIKSISTNYQCDKCKNIDDAEVSIGHSQLTCGVGAFLANPLTLAITAVLLSISKIFSS